MFLARISQAGKIQDEPGISCGARKKNSAQRNNGGIFKGHMIQFEEAPNSQTWNNLNNKMNNWIITHRLR